MNSVTAYPREETLEPADALLGHHLEAQLRLSPRQDAGATDDIPAEPLGEDGLDGFGRGEPDRGFADVK